MQPPGAVGKARACRGAPVPPRLDRRGSYAVIVGLAMVPMLGFAALAIDVSYMFLVRNEARAAAQAAARMASIRLREGASEAQIRNAAGAAAQEYVVAGHQVDFDEDMDLALGTWDYSSQSFSESGPGLNAARVLFHRGSSGGQPLSLFLGPLLGRDTVDLELESIAALRHHQVMLVLDVAQGMEAAMDDARDSILDFLDAACNCSLDSMGLVTVVGSAADASGARAPWTPLTTIASTAEYLSLKTSWNSLTWCNRPYGSTPHLAPNMPRCDAPWGDEAPSGSGTNHGDGMDLALDELLSHGDPESSRAIVLITDSGPNDPGGHLSTAALRNLASAAAASAAAADVHLYVLMDLGTLGGTGASFMQTLVEVPQDYYQLSSSSEFSGAMQHLASRVPVALLE